MRTLVCVCVFRWCVWVCVCMLVCMHVKCGGRGGGVVTVLQYGEELWDVDEHWLLCSLWAVWWRAMSCWWKLTVVFCSLWAVWWRDIRIISCWWTLAAVFAVCQQYGEELWLWDVDEHWLFSQFVSSMVKKYEMLMNIDCLVCSLWVVWWRAMGCWWTLTVFAVCEQYGEKLWEDPGGALQAVPELDLCSCQRHIPAAGTLHAGGPFPIRFVRPVSIAESTFYPPHLLMND